MKRFLSLLCVLAPLSAAAAGPAPGPRHLEGELVPLEGKVVMLHGLTLDGTYQRGLPVACAHLQPARGGGPPVERTRN